MAVEFLCRGDTRPEFDVQAKVNHHHLCDAKADNIIASVSMPR
jgi:hypothetical protein